ncbi:MAG: hypothetical protein WBA93_14590 [Microcoleaceae cyanobacterium]
MTLSLSVPEKLTFEEAIAFTQDLLSDMEKDLLSAAEIESLIGDLVKSKNGARGFFVTYLTDSRPLADNPSSSIFKALESAPETVTELLVKNLAMSSAMVVHHQRNQDQQTASESERVRSRTTKLIKSVNIPNLQGNLEELYQSTTTGQGNYTEFLERWGYDGEQLKSIQQAVQPLLN